MGSLRFIDRTNLGGKPRLSYINLAKAILEKSEGKVRLTGLGARDSL